MTQLIKNTSPQDLELYAASAARINLARDGERKRLWAEMEGLSPERTATLRRIFSIESQFADTNRREYGGMFPDKERPPIGYFLAFVRVVRASKDIEYQAYLGTRGSLQSSEGPDPRQRPTD